jgi:uncharacterized protein YbaR (Trm112 family)
MTLSLPPCPNCGNNLRVEEQEQASSPSRVFVCRGCSFIWRVPRPRKTARAILAAWRT